MFAYLAVQIKSIFTAASLIKVHTLIAMQTCIRYLINHNLAIFIIVSELQKVHYCNYKQSLVSSFFFAENHKSDSKRTIAMAFCISH